MPKPCIRPWDHPRIRGEHLAAWDVTVPQTGSSPHTRGALQGLLPRVIRVGIIPAYAGSTLLELQRRIRLRDHPRIRGEHGESTGKPCYILGSSPHTRGAQTSDNFKTADSGIIPAYAGSTLLSARQSLSQRDHPRIRGEHIVFALGLIIFTGSSPHTRGAPSV